MAHLLFQLLFVTLTIFGNACGFFTSSKVKNATKYELQQKVLTLGSSYTVKDDHGQAVYKVKLNNY